VATEPSLDFAARYTARYGLHAPPLNGHGEGCYDGVRLLAALAERAGSLAVGAVDAAGDGTTLTGGRGEFTLSDRHAVQPVYLARADGLDFDVLAAF